MRHKYGIDISAVIFRTFSVTLSKAGELKTLLPNALFGEYFVSVLVLLLYT